MDTINIDLLLVLMQVNHCRFPVPFPLQYGSIMENYLIFVNWLLMGRLNGFSKKIADRSDIFHCTEHTITLRSCAGNELIDMFDFEHQSFVSAYRSFYR